MGFIICFFTPSCSFHLLFLQAAINLNKFVLRNGLKCGQARLSILKTLLNWDLSQGTRSYQGSNLRQKERTSKGRVLNIMEGSFGGSVREAVLGPVPRKQILR